MSQCTCKNRPAASWTSDVGPSWYRHEEKCHYAQLSAQQKAEKKGSHKKGRS